MNEYTIRAIYTPDTIRVYQAFRPEVALPAVKAQRFVPPFSMTRMTWIKPSFNWMMYRCGCGEKPDQDVVLGIDITRQGFEWALENAVLSAFHPAKHGTQEAWKRLVGEKPVRIQWDPERDSRLRVIDGVRAIQIGLSGEAVARYVRDWIVGIEDVSPIAREFAGVLRGGGSGRTFPCDLERAYPMPPSAAGAILPD